ncbi:MAG: hypothetical protein WCW67_02940 [Candidatus Margulisiibacteriota bacterium]|jgi:hypothetical protein
MDGIFGVNPNNKVNNHQESKKTATPGGIDFKAALGELAATAQKKVNNKGGKEGLEFDNWRDLEETLYYDKEEVEEKATLENIKKLKKMIKSKLEGERK